VERAGAASEPPMTAAPVESNLRLLISLFWMDDFDI
jgi:hypothetical protein